MEGTLGHDGRSGQNIAVVSERNADRRRRAVQGTGEEAAGHEFRPRQETPGQGG